MSGQNITNTPPVGPIAQQLTHISSNGQLQSQKKTSNWTGFSGKTLWDWLQLLAALAIPLAVAFGTTYFAYQQNQLADVQHKHEVDAANIQHQHDIVLQTDQQRETTLVSYIQDIKDLISIDGLQKSKPGDEVRVIARAQTLITLRQLDGTRKGILVEFLSEARLITRNNICIDLSGADLSNATLDSADLSGAHLIGANLSNATLKYTDLNGATLNSADLNGATLKGANLSGTDLRDATLKGANLNDTYLRDASLSSTTLEGADLKGATMPDGSIHS